MSEEHLKAFLEAVKADTSLQEKLKSAADANAVAEIAKEAGFMISADDFKSAQTDISEEELEGVAGGACSSVDVGCVVLGVAVGLEMGLENLTKH